MEIRTICDEIAQIIEKMFYGQIEFKYDNLMCATKPGHPAEILDEILSIIGWDVFADKTPEKENIEKMLIELKEYVKVFKVKELKKPMADLKEYLKNA